MQLTNLLTDPDHSPATCWWTLSSWPTCWWTLTIHLQPSVGPWPFTCNLLMDPDHSPTTFWWTLTSWPACWWTLISWPTCWWILTSWQTGWWTLTSWQSCWWTLTSWITCWWTLASWPTCWWTLKLKINTKSIKPQREIVSPVYQYTVHISLWDSSQLLSVDSQLYSIIILKRDRLAGE